MTVAMFVAKSSGSFTLWQSAPASEDVEDLANTFSESLQPDFPRAARPVEVQGASCLCTLSVINSGMAIEPHKQHDV